MEPLLDEKREGAIIGKIWFPGHVWGKKNEGKFSSRLWEREEWDIIVLGLRERDPLINFCQAAVVHLRLECCLTTLTPSRTIVTGVTYWFLSFVRWAHFTSVCSCRMAWIEFRASLAVDRHTTCPALHEAKGWSMWRCTISSSWAVDFPTRSISL